MSRVLLVNFEESERKKLEERVANISLDSGYLGGEYTEISTPPFTFFRFPLSVYEYDVVCMKLNGKTRGEIPNLTEIAHGSPDVEDLCRFWSEGKGVVVLFLEEACFGSLWFLGFDHLRIPPARGCDRTVVSRKGQHPLELMLHEKKGLVRMPAPCYIGLPPQHTTPVILYENLNNQVLGLCYYKPLDLSSPPPNNLSPPEAPREPYLLVLPPFKDYVEITHEILKCIASTRKTLLPEIRQADWKNSDDYYPPEVAQIEDEIAKTVTEYEEKVLDLRQRKETAKKNWAFLPEILAATGDSLKSSVMKVFREIWRPCSLK